MRTKVATALALAAALLTGCAATYFVPMNSNGVVLVPGFATTNSLTTNGADAVFRSLLTTNGVTSYGPIWAKASPLGYAPFALFAASDVALENPLFYVDANGDGYIRRVLHVGTNSLVMSNYATGTAFIEGGVPVLTLRSNGLFGNAGGLTNLNYSAITNPPALQAYVLTNGYPWPAFANGFSSTNSTSQLLVSNTASGTVFYQDGVAAFRVVTNWLPSDPPYLGATVRKVQVGTDWVSGQSKSADKWVSYLDVNGGISILSGSDTNWGFNMRFSSTAPPGQGSLIWSPLHYGTNVDTGEGVAMKLSSKGDLYVYQALDANTNTLYVGGGNVFIGTPATNDYLLPYYPVRQGATWFNGAVNVASASGLASTLLFANSFYGQGTTPETVFTTPASFPPGALMHSLTVTNGVTATTFTGNASCLTNLQATNLAGSFIAPLTIVSNTTAGDEVDRWPYLKLSYMDASAGLSFDGTSLILGTPSTTWAGITSDGGISASNVTAFHSFTGNGGALTNLNYSAITNPPAAYALPSYVLTNGQLGNIQMQGELQLTNRIFFYGSGLSIGDGVYGSAISHYPPNNRLGIYDGGGVSLQTYDGASVIDALSVVGPSGNVGIGTNSPQAKLHVLTDGGSSALFESSAVYASTFTKAATSTYGSGIVDSYNGTDIYNNNIPAIHIGTSGNVGIGTASPTSKLDVRGSMNVDTNTLVVTNGSVYVGQSAIPDGLESYFKVHMGGTVFSDSVTINNGVLIVDDIYGRGANPTRFSFGLSSDTNATIGGTLTVTNGAVIYGNGGKTNWTETTAAGWLNTNANGGNVRIAQGAVTASGTVTATNFVLSIPRWVDSPVTFTWGTGGTAPSRAAYTSSRMAGISALAWQDADAADFTCQIGHNISPSNATGYVEAHLHVMPLADPTPSNNRKKFTLIYSGAAVNGVAYGPVTNVMDNVLISTNTATLVEFSHLNFTNFYPGISGIFMGTLTVSAATQSNMNSGNITIVGCDFHYPADRIGSSVDNAP